MGLGEECLPDLYAEALELDPEGRRALLAGLREEQPALAEELGRLLSWPQSAGSPIDLLAVAALGLDPGGPLPAPGGSPRRRRSSSR